MKIALVFVFLALLVPRIAAENTERFSDAITNAASYLESRIPPKTKLAVLRVAAKNADGAIAEYIVDSLSSHLVNTGKFTVVDRHNQETIQKEFDFQTTEEVDTRTAASIGQKVGAQTIVLGSYDAGAVKRLTIRAIDVEKAGVLGIRSAFIKNDAVLTALEGGHVFFKLGKPIEESLHDASEYISSRVPARMKMAVVISSSGQTLSTYTTDTLTEFLVNSDNYYTVVERQYLDDLRGELKFQYSGEVNDKTAVSIGRRIGAQCIALGTFKPLGSFLRLTIRAINVETAALLGLENYIINKDAMLSSLLKKGEWPAWKHKLVYAGARAGGALHFYTLNTPYSIELTSPVAFEAALTADVRLGKYIGAASELSYSYDAFRVESQFFSSELHAPSLAIPLFVRAGFQPGPFSLWCFAGPYIRIPCGNLTLEYNGVSEEYPFSISPGIAGGIEAGFHAGPGALVAGIRFAQDFFFIDANGAKQYRAASFGFSIGYKIGFFLTDY
ncbi:MAG: hypothetical protein LBC77_02615 [Spirochaetaceae bacterium]|jgi:curli biogenesis system outer membrane secretion channel CsgG|nr:hypothetical protein [Spirochaetaceae bacterium]